MAIGTIFLTLPIALLGSLWMTAVHGLSAFQTLGLYSGLGAMMLFVVFLGTVLALRDI